MQFAWDMFKDQIVVLKGCEPSATLLLTFLRIFQNVRLVWSVRIVTGMSVAAT